MSFYMYGVGWSSKGVEEELACGTFFFFFPHLFVPQLNGRFGRDCGGAKSAEHSLAFSSSEKENSNKAAERCTGTINETKEKTEKTEKTEKSPQQAGLWRPKAQARARRTRCAT